MKENEFTIEKNDSGQRFDKFLLKYMNKAPKSFVYKMLRKKRIKLNGKKAEGNEILCVGDTINFYISPETILSFTEKKELTAKSSDLDIIYEDENIILINKPCGIVVQRDKNNSESLNDMLLLYLDKKGELDSIFTPSVCNRLDRNTSGIVAAAKNLPAAQALSKAFREKELDKYYITVVFGEIDSSGVLKGFHIKDTETNKVSITDEYKDGSKEVTTQYEPIVSKDGFTLLKIKLITGKSHQIRAMLQKFGCPIVGDRKYGRPTNKFPVENQILHCFEIEFHQRDTVLDYLCGKRFTAEPKGIYKECFDFFR